MYVLERATDRASQLGVTAELTAVEGHATQRLVSIAEDEFRRDHRRECRDDGPQTLHVGQRPASRIAPLADRCPHPANGMMDGPRR